MLESKFVVILKATIFVLFFEEFFDYRKQIISHGEQYIKIIDFDLLCDSCTIGLVFITTENKMQK